jgi:hypothetical protein
MRVKSRHAVLSIKVTCEVRTLVEQLAAKLTLARRKRHTMTDVLVEGVRLLAKQEKVK